MYINYFVEYRRGCNFIFWLLLLFKKIFTILLYRFSHVLRVRTESQTGEKERRRRQRGCLRHAASSRSLITANERGWCAQRVAAREEREWDT